MKKSKDILSSYYPEILISDYTSVDGTVEFYSRINSLLNPSMSVLDFGAGRAAWYEDDACDYRKIIRTIKGKVQRIVGCDVDEAIFNNNSVDERTQIKISDPLPFGNESFDVIISDFTFEHVSNPNEIAREFHRILKKGGWICARTPNKYSYISIFTRVIKNSYHAKLLKMVQPDKKEVDIFPTTFKLNTLKDLAKHFPHDLFDDFTYRYEAEPAYYFNNKFVFSAMLLLNKYLPSIMKSNLFIFLKKQ